MKKLFGTKDVSPYCEYCAHGRLSPDKESVLCKKLGIVTKDFNCKKFKYDPLKRQPKRPKQLDKFNEEDFSLNVDEE